MSLTVIKGIASYKKRLAFKLNLYAWVLLAPTVILMILLIWYPQIQSIYLSMFKMKGYTPVEFVGLGNYINVLTDTQFLKLLWNTTQYVLWSLIVGFPLPIITAVFLNEMVHFKSALKFGIYFPVVLPSISAALIWFMIYYPDESGLLNMLLSMFNIEPQMWLQNENMTIFLIVLSMTWKSYGGTMLLFLAALQGVNRELYEAAQLDGAGVLRRTWSITLPQISGVVLLMLVRQIISVFQVFEQPMAMTGGGPNNASMTLVYEVYQKAFLDFRLGAGLALGMIVTIILMIATVFYFYLSKKVES